MPKKKWGLVDKIIITYRLWAQVKGGVHTFCGKCGSHKINIVQASELTKLEDGTDVHSTIESCRNCGAEAVVYEIWKDNHEALVAHLNMRKDQAIKDKVFQKG